MDGTLCYAIDSETSLGSLKISRCYARAEYEKSKSSSFNRVSKIIETGLLLLSFLAVNAANELISLTEM